MAIEVSSGTVTVISTVTISVALRTLFLTVALIDASTMATVPIGLTGMTDSAA